MIRFGKFTLGLKLALSGLVSLAVLVPLLLMNVPLAGGYPPPSAPLTRRPTYQPPQNRETPAERGYRLMRTKPLLPPDFSQEVFEDLWTVWPDELRKEAEGATPDERRAMAFRRYGLVAAEDRFGQAALGYTQQTTPTGVQWVMNCLACHGGQIEGKTVPGLPNSTYALQTLTQDVKALKLKRNLPLGHMEKGSAFIPLGETNGTTNAVVFGVALVSLRDKDVNFAPRLEVPEYVHHDLDAPPFWNVKKKTHLYYDGFVEKDHRSLLQFVTIPQNSGKTIRGWERYANDFLLWIESCEPPPYTGTIDQDLARRGEVLFNQTCADCHGTYGDNETYPNKLVSISVVRTDPVRLKAIPSKHKRAYGEGWFGHYGEIEVRPDTEGYVAPPLDGIWASAPYLHNGSVPTLYHLMHPEQRPLVWRRTDPTGYDHERLGVVMETYDEVPAGVSDAERRTYFDTTLKGKNAQGHTFPNLLSDEEKRAVLEYLKTL